MVTWVELGALELHGRGLGVIERVDRHLLHAVCVLHLMGACSQMVGVSSHVLDVVHHADIINDVARLRLLVMILGVERRFYLVLISSLFDV